MKRFMTLCAWLMAVAAAGWAIIVLLELGGMVVVHLPAYEIRVALAPASMLLVAAVLLCVLIVSGLEKLYAVSRARRLQRQLAKQESGLGALTHALVAMAGARLPEAERYMEQARGALGDHAAVDLLSAQVAHQMGDTALTRGRLQRLTQHEATRALAHQALSGVSLREGEVMQALEYAQAARKDAPKDVQTQVHTLGLLVRVGRYDEAERLIFQARLKRQITGAQAKHFEAVVCLQRAQQHSAQVHVNTDTVLWLAKKACGNAPSLVPAALFLAQHYAGSGDYRPALKTLLRCWREAAHPQLAERLLEYCAHMPLKTQEKHVLSWVQVHPHAPCAAVLQARFLMTQRRWEDARYVLKAALSHAEDVSVLNLLAEVEPQLDPKESSKAAAVWLKRALLAPASAAWHCRACGHLHPVWQAHCDGCQSFDTVVWGVFLKGHGETRAALGIYGY
jgi:HemY protein